MSRSGPRPAPEPVVPADPDVDVVDPGVRRDLSAALPGGRAERAVAHLATVAELLAGDPESAYAHARHVRRQTGRVPGVREAAGLAAYRTGRYAEALGELRAWRRMTGGADHLPLLADCERGLGRPERSLKLAADPDARRLDGQARAELAIVVAGARRDLGETSAALAVLRPLAEADGIEPWTVRVWYAYADALLAAGQPSEAREWFAAAAAIDEDGETDADARATEATRAG
jgi:tetratricopeptide (TPR) repeat protein